MNSRAASGQVRELLNAEAGGYTVGVLVQCNYGSREQLRVAGINVGREIPEHTVWQKTSARSSW